MNILFLQYGNRPLDVACAQIMMESARRHMPKCQIIQATDYDTPRVPGVDAVQRIEYTDDDLFGSYRCKHEMAMCDQVYISVDVDVIFNADVSYLFETDWEIALTTRGNEEIGMLTKYIGGFIPCRSRRFWKHVSGIVNQMPGPLRAWYGVQAALEIAVRDMKHPDCALLELPSRKYNYKIPDVYPMEYARFDTAEILHFRGKDAKERMVREFSALTLNRGENPLAIKASVTE